MKQYQQLVAIGCSFTFGHETSAPGIWREDDPSRAWPAHLGRRLGCPVVNLAWCGENNDWIYWRLSQYLLNNPLPASSLVAVQWTFFNRIMAFNPANANINGSVSPALLSEQWVKEHIGDKFFRHYVEFLSVDPRNIISVLFHTLHLKLILAAYGHDLIYWPAAKVDAQLPGTRHVPQEYRPQLEQFHADSLLAPGSNWEGMMFNWGRSGCHFSTSTHEHWSDLVFDYLNTGEKNA